MIQKNQQLSSHQKKHKFRRKYLLLNNKTNQISLGLKFKILKLQKTSIKNNLWLESMAHYKKDNYFEKFNRNKFVPLVNVIKKSLETNPHMKGQYWIHK